MAFCKNCGTELNEDAAFCPKCGTPQGAAQPAQDLSQNQYPNNQGYQYQDQSQYNNQYSNQYNNQYQNQPAVQDTGSIGWGVLGFCIPLVGLILFLVWKDQKPKTAKVAGMGALISVCIAVVWYILMFVLAFLFV